MASVNTVEKNKRPTMGPEVFKLSAASSAFSLNPAAMMEKMTNAHEAKYYGLCRFAVVNGES
jgi:hypothetical protein